MPNARRLVAFDRLMNQEGKTLEEKLPHMKQFVTSCGVEYGEGWCVTRTESKKGPPRTNEDYLNGVIFPGRRLLNCKVKRFADGTIRDMHDELRAEGRFSIVMLAGDDFGDKDGRSTKVASDICCNVLRMFLPGLIQPIILHPSLEQDLKWTDLPGCIKEGAEMSLYSASPEVYRLYGIDYQGSQAGALIVVRPDGFVGMRAELEDMQQVIIFLRRIVRMNDIE